jgi:hypothetical protein
VRFFSLAARLVFEDAGVEHRAGQLLGFQVAFDVDAVRLKGGRVPGDGKLVRIFLARQIGACQLGALARFFGDSSLARVHEQVEGLGWVGQAALADDVVDVTGGRAQAGNPGSRNAGRVGKHGQGARRHSQRGRVGIDGPKAGYGFGEPGRIERHLGIEHPIQDAR